MSLSVDPNSLGDPVGMRALAATMNRIADEIANRVEAVDRRFDSTTFEGPAARRVGDRVDGYRDRVVATARQLKSAAAALVRQAAEVEAAIIELRRRQQEQLEREARETWA